MRSVESRVRVRYAETDNMGIAHHANYLVWFEIGRTDLCRATGVTYREIEERGFIMVVTEIHCRYRVPFRYDDEVTIVTSVERAASRQMTFAYELRRGEAVHANGSSTHVWVDEATRKPVTAPRDILEAFAPFVEIGVRRRASENA